MTRAVLLTALLGVVVAFSGVRMSAEPLPAKEENVSKAARRAASIKENKRYYHAVGYGETADEADRDAINGLCKNINMTVGGVALSKETLDSEQFSDEGVISTFVTLSNTERIDISTTPGQWEVLRYVEKAQVQNDMAMRDERIRTLVEQGLSLEKRLEIGGALKYFNWAYALSKCTQKPTMLDINKKAYDARTWLESHINTVFSTLSVSLGEVEELPDELDPFLVNLSISYGGQPVADLDFSYINNGIVVPDQHVKNGRASLAFEKLPADKIILGVAYKYEEEGSQYDPELRTIFSARRAASFPKANIEIPCKGATAAKFEVKERKLSKAEAREAKAAAAIAPAVADPLIERIETTPLVDSRGHRLASAMGKVWEAVGSGALAGIRDLFTPDGYALFLKMMQSGKVKQAVSKPDLRIELAGDYVVGKSLPVTVTYQGGHKVAEEIVCRFNSDDKIESVAYALTKRAEDDIFRQNEWSLPARYTILHFMEDYQTAYALKRLDYIKSIYSDDAVIIRGKLKEKSGSKTDSGNYFLTNKYTYTTETKDQFVETLRKQFAEKRYIKLTFEDNEIKEQSGIYNDIYWIEIKQFYSSSNYNDQGYLSLMIDMREAAPVIKVRTWAPGKIPLKDLMSRYTQQ